MTTYKDWIKFCIEGVMLEAPIFTVGIRKIVPDAIFSTTIDDSVQLTNSVYSENGSKISQLKKYYYNAGEIEAAKAALKVMQTKKKYGSVAFSMKGEHKKFTHHQHCLQTMSIRHQPKQELEYSAFIRSSELVKTFTGDLVFIRDVVMQEFTPGPITFFICNASLNSMYCPLFFLHSDLLTDGHLKILKRIDPAFHERFKGWCHRYFDNDHINYASAERVRKYLFANTDAKERKNILRRMQ